MEILRFGPGFRRRRDHEGSTGLADGAIWSDPRARVTELSFADRALLAPHTSPDRGLLIVVAGGGWVQVGEERAAVHHGEAIEWPPGVAHGAWTDGSTMRAILVEVPDADIGAPTARVPERAGQGEVTPARGRLAVRPARPDAHDPSEGEPW